jgi:hypothetical protein
MLMGRNETESHFGQNRNKTELFWSIGTRPNLLISNRNENKSQNWNETELQNRNETESQNRNETEFKF